MILQSPPVDIWCCEDRTAPFVDIFSKSAIDNGYRLHIIAPDKLCVKYEHFRAHYHHLSPNPEFFELASFRRWFEIAQHVGPNDRFVLADSDLIIAAPFATLPKSIRDFDGLVGSIGAHEGILEKGINGGFSIWTGRMLHDFCDYLVHTYETGFESLQQIYAARVSNGDNRASISDMTLLYNWVKEANIPFLNSNRLLSNEDRTSIYIDHNFFMPQGIDVKFKMAFGRKRLYRKKQEIWLQTDTDQPVRANSLHLGGRYKIMAADIAHNRTFKVITKSTYISAGRSIRYLLSKTGINV